MSDITSEILPNKKRSFICALKRFLRRHRSVKPLIPFPLADLAPKDDSHHDDKAKTYFRALRGALDNNRVTNIAITGHYGCGKSSILSTYKTHYGAGHKFLNISLATFGQDIDSRNRHSKANGTQDDDKPAKENRKQEQDKDEKLSNKGGDDSGQRRTNYLVEHSILQQIIYQVPKADIPRSRFKRIGRPSPLGKTWLVFLLWGLCLGTGIAVFRPDFYKPIKLFHSLITVLPDWLIAILGLLALGTILIPAGLLFRFVNTGALRRFRLKACELEMADDKDPSMLNKHLDEILYFFDATEYDIVVIEDLDRFDTPDIFTKLREINTLINQNRVANGKKGKRNKQARRVVFIYAIKDEMFTGEERTKFFDLIIPVLPVVNYENSRVLLNRELEKILPADEFQSLHNLIKEISRYIADMRLIYNIVNEFAIYRDRLNLKGLTAESLLALMAYKNIMPQDFANLHMRKGFLFEYFNQKGECRKSLIADHEQEIRDKRKKLADAKQCNLQSAEELRILYLFNLKKLADDSCGQQTVVQVHNGEQWVPINGALDENLFDILINSSQIKVRFPQYGGANDISTEKLQQSVDANLSYQERKQLIELKSEKEQNTIQSQIRFLEENIVELKHSKLSQLMRRSEFTAPDAKAFLVTDNEHESTKKREFVEMLLKQGYIKEDYGAYLSYFYEGVLSNKGREFLIAVQNSRPLDPDYELDRESIVEIVDNQLAEHEVTAQATRNIFILNYLLEKHVADAVISQYKRAPEKTDNLLLALKTPGLAHGELINTLFSEWPEFWDHITSSEVITEVETDLYLAAIIKYASLGVIERICEASFLGDDISKRREFVRFAEKLDVTRVIPFLDVVKPEFLELSYFPKESQVAKHIYDNGFYEVNVDMVSLVYHTFERASQNDDIPTLTEILSNTKTPIYDRIMKHLESFVGELILLDGVLKREDEETAIRLLNKDYVSHELRLKLASGLLTEITNLGDVDKHPELWKQLIDAKAVIPSWENIWVYLNNVSSGELDKTLVNYISDESVATALGSHKLNPDYLNNTDDSPDVGLLFLCSPEFEQNILEQLVLTLPSDYSVNSLASVNPAAISILVERKHVPFTPDNYEIIRAKCHNSLAAFVKEYLDVFLEAVDELTIDGIDLNNIISVPYMRDDRKKQIIEVVLRKGISGKLSAVSNMVCELFLADHAFAESLGSETVKCVLVALRQVSLKIEVLTYCIPWFNDEQIVAVLKSAGGDYSKLTEHGKRPTFPKNEKIEAFASSLLQRGFIGRKVDKGGTLTLTTPFGARKSEH